MLFFSCKEREKHTITIQLLASESLQYNQDKDIVMIDQQDFEIVPFHDMNTKIKDIYYIPFFSEEPIGIFDELILYDKYVIVLDAFLAEKVYIFDMSGNLINIIAQKGRGPEEYHGLSDISISKNENLLALNDRLSLNMLYFTLDGQFVRKTKAAPCCNFEIYENKIINQAAYSQSFSNDLEQNYNLTVSIYDSILYKGFPYYPLQVQAVNSNCLQYNQNGELLYTPTLSDTIYAITSDSTYSVRYVVNQKKSIWDKKDENLTTDQYRDLIKKSKYTYLQPPILETTNFVFYQINYGKDNNIASQSYWYDKNKKRSFKIGQLELGNKKVPNCLPYPKAIYENYYVGIYLPHEVEEMTKLTDNKTVVFENEELNQILQENKNKKMEFLLVMYELK